MLDWIVFVSSGCFNLNLTFLFRKSIQPSQRMFCCDMSIQKFPVECMFLCQDLYIYYCLICSHSRTVVLFWRRQYSKLQNSFWHFQKNMGLYPSMLFLKITRLKSRKMYYNIAFLVSCVLYKKITILLHFTYHVVWQMYILDSWPPSGHFLSSLVEKTSITITRNITVLLKLLIQSQESGQRRVVCNITADNKWRGRAWVDIT